MERLYVLYDARCGLCSWAKRWLMRQPAWIDLRFIPAGSEWATRLFPALYRPGEPEEELVVVGDQGAVYREAAAWIMCLFALQDYRDWANRLAHPLLRPLAREGFALLSRQRSRVSRWLSLASEFEIAQTLGQIHVPACSAELQAPGCSSEPIDASAPVQPPPVIGPAVNETAADAETASKIETAADAETASKIETAAEDEAASKIETAAAPETAAEDAGPREAY